jgi:predicted translin family RNA/ssDNA-binding protein
MSESLNDIIARLEKEIKELKTMIANINSNNTKGITSQDVSELIEAKVTESYVTNLYKGK